jgi:DNA modification methylase
MVYPTNVLHLATETGNKSHSAVFPSDLPEWFIKLFTKPGDLVLDPFVGSGTTALSAIQLGRHFVGIDVSEEYIQLANQRVFEKQIKLPIIGEKKAKYTVSKNGKKGKK